MIQPHALEAPQRAKPSADVEADAHLERLKALADRGGSGVNLAAMDRDEVRRRLLKR